ncbi:MAG: hypothetical protein ABL984_06790, partial [Pyrinomonadaceae bacterium]
MLRITRRSAPGLAHLPCGRTEAHLRARSRFPLASPLGVAALLLGTVGCPGPAPVTPDAGTI